MSYQNTPSVTPFIPPLPSPGGGLLVPPVVPNPPVPSPQRNNLPGWADEPQTAANYPTMSPYTPYTPHTPFGGSPFIPRMEGMDAPALAPAQPPAPNPPGSYFAPPRNLPPNTPHHV